MVRFFRPVAAATRLSRQVRWQDPIFANSGIEQTCLAIEDGPVGAKEPFSFVVIGDTDLNGHAVSKPAVSEFAHLFARQIQMHMCNNRFLLHTGDVVYPNGSYQNYFSHLLQLYPSLLRDAPKAPFYCGDQVTFTRPVLPVPGNHDYGMELRGLERWKVFLSSVCDRLRNACGIDLGHYGGTGGEAYGQTFLDDLSQLSPAQLKQHLIRHYSAVSDHAQTTGQTQKSCLSYLPGQFTRLPNRYYRFHYGGIDFFALDSNTWNCAPDTPNFDQAQLDWLTNALIESWNTPTTVGRIIYLHHSPYTTEATHWQSSETLWVRKHLRAVLDRVRLERMNNTHWLDAEHSIEAPLVDLVLSGHAHCLEHLKSGQTGHGDAHIDWLVCGGSGISPRRQRLGEPNILETISRQGRQTPEIVATSQLYVGQHGKGAKEQKFHSFVRINVQPNEAQKITICPFVVTQIEGIWTTKALSPFAVGRPISTSPKRVKV
ncbi:MAG: metallophosphoesterase [Cyanobacteria bacterium J06621_3]